MILKLVSYWFVIMFALPQKHFVVLLLPSCKPRGQTGVSMSLTPANSRNSRIQANGSERCGWLLDYVPASCAGGLLVFPITELPRGVARWLADMEEQPGADGFANRHPQCDAAEFFLALEHNFV